LPSKMPDSAEGAHDDGTVPAPPSECPQPTRPQERRKLKELQPRGPPKNPFATRPALLRNVRFFYYTGCRSYRLTKPISYCYLKYV
jgi:hypothetical protein